MPVFFHLMTLSMEQWTISLPRLMQHGAMGDLAAAVDARFFPFNERGTMGDLAAAVDARFFPI